MAAPELKIEELCTQKCVATDAQRAEILKMGSFQAD